jgi:hypothetical protein
VFLSAERSAKAVGSEQRFSFRDSEESMEYRFICIYLDLDSVIVYDFSEGKEE